MPVNENHVRGWFQLKGPRHSANNMNELIDGGAERGDENSRKKAQHEGKDEFHRQSLGMQHCLFLPSMPQVFGLPAKRFRDVGAELLTLNQGRDK